MITETLTHTTRETVIPVAPEAFSTEFSSEQTTGSDPIKDAFAKIHPPLSSPDDSIDPVEARIYNLLGDVTLPRSFLPAIQVIAKTQLETEKRAIALRLDARPHEKERYEKSEANWPGKSPEVDQKILQDKKNKMFNSLIFTRQMTEFRRLGSEIHNLYIGSNISASFLAQAHILRRSEDLWERMSVFAKDYLTYGGDRAPKVDVDVQEIEDLIEEIRTISEGISRVETSGIVHLERSESEDKFYRWNDLEFTFKDGGIAALRIDEGTSRDEHSPLFSFIMSESELEGVKNGFSDGTMVGPFNVGVIFHEYGEAEHNIIIKIDTGSWTKEQIFDFIGRYLHFLKTESRLEGTPAKLQLIDGGIISAEAYRI